MPRDLFALLGQPLHGEVQGLNSESEGFQFLNCLGSRAGMIEFFSIPFQKVTNVQAKIAFFNENVTSEPPGPWGS